MTKRIYGKVGNSGCTTGEALVVKNSFGFWGATNPKQGIITDYFNEARGQSFKDRILVAPSTKGSSGNWIILRLCGRLNTNPKAILSNYGDPLIVGASIENDTPYMYNFEKNLLDNIKTGDKIKVNANKGYIEILTNDE